MKDTFLKEGTLKLGIVLRAVGLKGKQVVEAIKVTTEGIVEDLKAEMDKGNYKEVVAFLGTNAVMLGKSVIMKRLTTRVASRLMLRLGLPGIIAAGVVAILVPFVVMKLRKKAAGSKDAGAFLKTFELPENPDLETQVQKALEDGTGYTDQEEDSPTDQAPLSKKSDAPLAQGD